MGQGRGPILFYTLFYPFLNGFNDKMDILLKRGLLNDI